MSVKDSLTSDFFVVIKDIHPLGFRYLHDFAGNVRYTGEELTSAICIHFQKVSEMLFGNNQSMARCDLRNI